MTLILPPNDPRTAQAVPRDTANGRSPAFATLLRIAPRLIGPLAMLVCGWFVWQGIEPGFGAEVKAALTDVSLGAWLLAVVAASVSLWTVGHYDALVHKAAGTGVAPGRARRAGRRAIAIGQAAGFGTVTGALVRWRSLPELGLVELSKFSVVVSLSFMAAWAVVSGAVALIVLGGAAGLFLLAGLGLLARRMPLPRIPGLPHLRKGHIGGLLVWTLLDTIAAAIVLWAFLPAEITLSPGLFFMAYLCALGAGMISQSPGGLGAFELALIGLLPQADPAGLVAAALGYRLVYHIGPAGLALLLLVRTPSLPETSELRLDAVPRHDRARKRAAHPDWGLTGQGAGLLMAPGKQAGWLVRQAPFTLVGLGPALNRPGVSALALAAQSRGQMAMLYKCTGREAALARKAGWSVMPVSREALIDPSRFDLGGRPLRQLRRKLRNVEKSGLTVDAQPSHLPLDAMAEVNQNWARAHGGERGFSMGRFDTETIHDQAVILGWHNNRLVGFVSFHTTGAGWGLDLMRHSHDAPNGTVQALIAAGIRAAKDSGVETLSLAACPIIPKWPGVLNRSLNGQRRAAAGLYQFKSAFGPRWETRYAAAPTAAQLSAGVVSVAWAVHRPKAIGEPDFRFEITGATCEGLGQHASHDIPTLLGQTTGATRPD